MRGVCIQCVRLFWANEDSVGLEDRSDVTAFRSFNNNTGKRVLDLLEAGDLILKL